VGRAAREARALVEGSTGGEQPQRDASNISIAGASPRKELTETSASMASKQQHQAAAAAQMLDVSPPQLRQVHTTHI